MKREGFEDELDIPLFSHHVGLRNVEQQLYGHVLAAIDFDALSRLEFVMSWWLAKHGVDKDLTLDLSMQAIQRALVRAADDPSRHGDFGPPHGVTPEEAAAVAFDKDCRFCLADAEHARESQHQHDDEACTCCDMLVNDWRREHAEVLKGLAKS